MFDQFLNLDRSVLSTIEHLWNFQLFEVDKSPITLGKVLIGLVLITVGYFVARSASRAIGNRVISRLQMQKSLQYTLERLAFYLIYIFVVLFVLQMLSIPVTIFALIGSAIAIGIGFGSQNVVNNFISGLIVMVEQPVRVGDWIELDGIFGHIEQIGSRSTYMRTPDNKQIIIPNSMFLEKMFVNWTLNDNTVGGKLSVGVNYGSDTEKVKSILIEAAQAHPHVLKSPVPEVAFVDFAESSLNFELIFWVSFYNGVSPKSVASDLRFRINELFRKQGVSMPFPHRELLFSADNTLKVKVEK